MSVRIDIMEKELIAYIIVWNHKEIKGIMTYHAVEWE